MIVDSSALTAIVFAEPDAAKFAVSIVAGRPARLQLGDCCSYALAKLRNEPLLYKGDDFAKTDIVSAI